MIQKFTDRASSDRSERLQTQVVVRWEDGSMGAVSQEWLDARGWQRHPGVVCGKKCEVVKSFVSQN